jgi:CheY-like chemotaxis protein
MVACSRNPILVVDDDPELREAIGEVLLEGGYEVVAARDGREALEILAAAEPRPSLVLLDLMMPNMNGWEFCDHRSRDARMSDVPVIVMTASRTHAPPAGAAEILHKPLQIQSLLDVVARWIPAS